MFPPLAVVLSQSSISGLGAGLGVHQGYAPFSTVLVFGLAKGHTLVVLLVAGSFSIHTALAMALSPWPII